jgi:hypothetical protein
MAEGSTVDTLLSGVACVVGGFVGCTTGAPSSRYEHPAVIQTHRSIIRIAAYFIIPDNYGIFKIKLFYVAVWGQVF